MNMYVLELSNDIRGTASRKKYIEELISRLPAPDLVVLPELSLCGYMPSTDLWKEADVKGRDASSWAGNIARKYHTAIGLGFIEEEDGEYYNSYLLAGEDTVYGKVRKSEGESYLFRRGTYPNIIQTPFGHVAVAICYDAQRRRFYDNIKNEEISLILFPHGSPADPLKMKEEKKRNDALLKAYHEAFAVPVVYVNSKGDMGSMPGITGKMMMKRGFRLNGLSEICSSHGRTLKTDIPEVMGMALEVNDKERSGEVVFHGESFFKGNWFFRHTVLKRDIRKGMKFYEEHRRQMK